MNSGMSMFGYVPDHHSEGERERLEPMSRLLYPTHHPYLEEFRIRAGARTLEDGSGNVSSTRGWPGEARPSLSISTCRWWMRSHGTSSSTKPTSSPDPSRPTSTCDRQGRAAPHRARSGRRRPSSSPPATRTGDPADRAGFPAGRRRQSHPACGVRARLARVVPPGGCRTLSRAPATPHWWPH